MPILKYVSGTYRSIYKSKEYEYKTFSPSLINKPFEWKDKKINLLLEQAVLFLDELSAYSMLIPMLILYSNNLEATTSVKLKVLKQQ